MLLLDYPKKFSAFSFVCILLKNDITGRILQLQYLLFGEIVSTTVEDGSLARILLTPTLRQLELISLPFDSNSNSVLKSPSVN